jgi:hypothetical protein
MNLFLKLWNQPTWVKWLIYLTTVYILFIIKEAFAIILWLLFCIIAKNIFKATSYYEKNNI